VWAVRDAVHRFLHEIRRGPRRDVAEAPDSAYRRPFSRSGIE